MFSILKETLAFNGYVKLWRRDVKFPDGRVIQWDVAGHGKPNPSFTIVFPYDTRTKTTTLVKEYCQGPNEVVFYKKYCFPSGGFDASKHKSLEDTAMLELSEEAHLKGGRLVRLLPETSDGIAELKWCTNKFVPYLCLDPVLDENPGERDPEEYMEIEHGVTLGRVNELILQGEMMLPSVQTFLMGSAYIAQHFGH